MDYSTFRRSSNIEDARGETVDPMRVHLYSPSPLEILLGAQTRRGPYDNDIAAFAGKANAPQFGVGEPTDMRSVLERMMAQSGMSYGKSF